MRTFLLAIALLGFFVGAIVGGMNLVSNVVIREDELARWVPALVGLGTMIFSAMLWVFLDIANAIAPVKKVTMNDLFPERHRNPSRTS